MIAHVPSLPLFLFLSISLFEKIATATLCFLISLLFNFLFSNYYCFYSKPVPLGKFFINGTVRYVYLLQMHVPPKSEFIKRVGIY